MIGFIIILFWKAHCANFVWQGVDVDLFGVQLIHVNKLIKIISADKTNNEQVFKILMKDVNNYADDVGIDFVVPRISSKQTLRSSYK